MEAPLPVMPALRPPRGLALVAGGAVLALVGGHLLGQVGVGLLVAVALLPLCFRWAGPGAAPWRPLRDGAEALLAGLLVAALCQWVLAPPLLAGGDTTASDPHNWMWSLHALHTEQWRFFLPNRYPFAPLVAHVFAFTGNPYDTWYLAAVASMVGTAAGLWLWGRAISGRGTAWAAALLVAAFPDLVLMVRTITGYPIILATWTLAAGLAAYALRHPHPWTLLLAGVGCGATFAADYRGLIPGLLVTGVSVLAAAGMPGRWHRRLVGLALVILPLYGSWLAHNRLPVRLNSLEDMLAASVGISYQRMGLEPPLEVQALAAGGQGWVWGRSLPWEIPASLQWMASAQGKLNPALAGWDEQQRAYRHFVEPLVAPLLVLGLLGVGASLVSRRGPEARAALDWRALVALVPLAGHLVWFYGGVVEYHARYFGLAMPGMALLAALGLAGPAGGRRPAWLGLVPVLVALLLVPGALNVRGGWRVARAADTDLQRCMTVARAPFGSAGPEAERDECVRAQRLPLEWVPRWPYPARPGGASGGSP